MLTQDDVKKIEDLLNSVSDRFDRKLEKEITKLELKIEANTEYSKSAHAEIMEKLVESNDINDQQLKKLQKRIDLLEEHSDNIRHNKN